MLSHLFCKSTQPNTSKVVDRESDISRIVPWEDTLQIRAEHVISHSSLELRQTNLFDDALEQNLDKDTTAGSSFILVEVDHRQAVPSEGVHANHVSKELGNIAQLVVFIAVNSFVILGE